MIADLTPLPADRQARNNQAQARFRKRRRLEKNKGRRNVAVRGEDLAFATCGYPEPPQFVADGFYELVAAHCRFFWRSRNMAEPKSVGWDMEWLGRHIFTREIPCQ